MKLNQADLDEFYIRGKISEDEYLHLATEDVSVLAIAVDRVDGFTTVSLSKESSFYSGEVLYPVDQTYLDEKFIKKESSLSNACDQFMKKVSALERRGHEFEIDWYIDRKKI
mgnify:CR=1 FL=1